MDPVNGIAKDKTVGVKNTGDVAKKHGEDSFTLAASYSDYGCDTESAKVVTVGGHILATTDGLLSFPEENTESICEAAKHVYLCGALAEGESGASVGAEDYAPVVLSIHINLSLVADPACKMKADVSVTSHGITYGFSKGKDAKSCCETFTVACERSVYEGSDRVSASYGLLIALCHTADETNESGGNT